MSARHPLPLGTAEPITVIVPAFNEAARLPATLTALAAFFAARPRLVEVLIVDDGSSDATAQILELHPPPANPRVTWRVLRNPGNRGKGYSVRHGMSAARYDRVLFTDADLAAPIAELDKLEAALQAGADIAIGSRRRELIGSRQSLVRENAGRFFNRIVRLSLGLRFHDTQCGFKLFNRAAVELLHPWQRIERWGFDPELLFVAQRGGLRVAEIPVAWSHIEGAKIRLLRDSARMFIDVVRIRLNAWRGMYPQPAGAAELTAASTEPQP